MTQPTNDVSALARLREKLAGMTPRPWVVEDGESIVNRDLTDRQWDANDEGRPAWDIATVPAPVNATGIVHAVSLARFVADEGTVERVARAICATWDYEWDGDPDADGQVAPDVSDGERPSKALYRRAAARILALIASAGEEA